MGSSYVIYDDSNMTIETTEQSSRYDLSIAFMTENAKFPLAVIELFNNETLTAKQFGEIGYNILYAAFLQMEDADIQDLKERISKL